MVVSRNDDVQTPDHSVIVRLAAPPNGSSPNNNVVDNDVHYDERSTPKKITTREIREKHRPIGNRHMLICRCHHERRKKNRPSSSRPIDPGFNLDAPPSIIRRPPGVASNMLPLATLGRSQISHWSV